MASSSLWRHPDFLKLWTGETISIFGSLVGYSAFNFTALIFLDAGPAGLAVLQACQAVPQFVAGPFAGVWVDRLPKRPILISTDIGRALVLATVPLAALFDLLTLGQLCVVAFVTSAMRVFFDVAYEAYLPALVEREHILEGNAKLTASASVAEISGFGVAGWLVQLLSGPGTILVDAVSFLVSAVFLGRIQKPEPPATPHHEREHMFREALEGASVVVRHPMLRTLAAMTVLLNLASGITGVAFLVYVVDDLGFEPGVLGSIWAIGGATSLIGAFVAARPGIYRRLGLALVVGTVVRTIGGLFVPLADGRNARSVGLMVANQLVQDPAWTFTEIHETSLRQSLTADRLLGRMNATMRVAGFGALLAGNGAAAAIAAMFGAREALFVAVALLGMTALLLALSPVARLRAQPPSLGSG
jgi:MFS family permease